MMRLLFLTLFFLSRAVFSCPSGSGADIVIRGTVSIETYPGPPNYESVKSGDRAEKYWFVTLAKSMCFDPDEQFMDSEVYIKKLQLLLFRMMGEVHLKAGEKYEFTGTTTPAITGHHRTKVMLEVSNIKAL